MSWVGVITNAGQQLINQLAAGDHTLYLDKATVGSGVSEAANMRIAVDLVNMQADASIVSRESVDGAVKIKVQIGPSDTEAYTAREVGLWAHIDDDESILFSLHQDSNGGMSIPLLSESPDFAFGMFIVIAVSNTESLQVNVDTSAIVSSDTLNRTIGGLTAHDVGAAPAGYGLGETTLDALENLNEAVAAGWYSFNMNTANAPYTGYGVVEVIPRVGGDTCLQRTHDLITTSSGFYNYGVSAERVYRDSAWQPWEYINPPMRFGVEYRTTERYNGNPVYRKLVDLGVSTNAKVITVLTSGNKMIRHVDRCSSYPLPHINQTMDSAYTYYLMPDQNGFALKMFCGANATGLQTYSVIYYYKE